MVAFWKWSKLLWWNFQNKASKRFLLKNNPLYVRVAFVIHIKLTFRLYGKFWAFFFLLDIFLLHQYIHNFLVSFLSCHINWSQSKFLSRIRVFNHLMTSTNHLSKPILLNVAHCVLFCFFGQVNDSSPFCLVTRSEAILGPFLLLKIRVFQNFIANVDWSIHNQFSYLVK